MHLHKKVRLGSAANDMVNSGQYIDIAVVTDGAWMTRSVRSRAQI